MKAVSQTTQFARDVKLMRRRGKDIAKLQSVVGLLAADASLPPKHRDHGLAGPWQSSRDCHIEPAWILIYTPATEWLRLERTGTHGDLFKK